MFTAQQTSEDTDPYLYEPDGSSSRASRGHSGLSRRGLDQIYVGKREAGVPTVLVVRETGAEYMPAAQRGAFSWGWPCTGGTRRLAHALLLDLTGRNAPPWVVDKIAAREVTQLPRASFSVTGRQILGWIGSCGDSILDWPPAQRSFTRSPIRSTASDALEGNIDRRVRWRARSPDPARSRGHGEPRELSPCRGSSEPSGNSAPLRAPAPRGAPLPGECALVTGLAGQRAGRVADVVKPFRSADIAAG
jgi:hypothetical protein